MHKQNKKTKIQNTLKKISIVPKRDVGRLVENLIILSNVVQTYRILCM